MGLKRLLIRLWPSATNRLRREAMQVVAERLTPERVAELDSLPGCLSLEQGSILHSLCAFRPQGGAVVEIGSFMGKSTAWLASAVEPAAPLKVTAIDPHTGHERPEVRTQQDSYAAFIENLRRLELLERVTPIREASQQVARRWNERIALLWVDGSHSYEDVLGDLRGFARHVLPGGHVALHDTRGRHFPGVRAAMLEYFGNDPRFERVAVLRNMTVYRRRHGT
jgi:MMP 1-O-methyltransferase